MQLKGASYELTIENGFDEACMLLEASRLEAKSAQIVAESADSAAGSRAGGHGAVHRDARADRDGAARLDEAEAPRRRLRPQGGGLEAVHAVRAAADVQEGRVRAARGAADGRALPDCARHRARRAADQGQGEGRRRRLPPGGRDVRRDVAAQVGRRHRVDLRRHRGSIICLEGRTSRRSSSRRPASPAASSASSPRTRPSASTSSPSPPRRRRRRRSPPPCASRWRGDGEPRLLRHLPQVPRAERDKHVGQARRSDQGRGDRPRLVRPRHHRARLPEAAQRGRADEDGDEVRTST